MSALTATLVNHHPGWPADMSAGPKLSRDIDPEQPTSGFTAVNGRPKGSSTESSPRQSDVFSPPKRDPQLDYPLQAHFQRHERRESESSLKRKRSDQDDVSPTSTASQRPYHHPSPPLLASSLQPNPSPHMAQEAGSTTGKPYGPESSYAWRRESDEHSPEARLVEAMQRDRDQASEEQHSPDAMETSPYSSHMSEPPGPGQPIPGNGPQAQGAFQKQRKRNFANRTKTGCLTCRERKKKCDEGKPTCGNCSRGGFSCKGYPNSSGYMKSSMSREQPALQAKHEYHHPIPHPMGYAPAPPQFGPSPSHYPPQPYSDIYSRPLPARREPARPPPPEARPEYSRPHPPPPPPAPAWQTPDPYQHPPLAPHGPPPPPHHYQQPPPPPHDMRPPPPHMMSYESPRELKRLPLPSQPASEPSRPPPYKERDSLVNTASSALYNLPKDTEFHKMINHRPFNPWDPELRNARAKCTKMVRRYNNYCLEASSLDDPEPQEQLKRVIEGDDASQRQLGGMVPLQPNGLGKRVEVQAPFHCDYSGSNLHIGDDTIIGANCRVENSCTVSIGRSCVIGSNVSFITASPEQHPEAPRLPGSTRRFFKGDPIKVYNDVVIGANCVITQGAHIHEGTHIPPGTFVDHNGSRRLPTLERSAV